MFFNFICIIFFFTKSSQKISLKKSDDLIIAESALTILVPQVFNQYIFNNLSKNWVRLAKSNIFFLHNKKKKNFYNIINKNKKINKKSHNS